MTTSTQSIVYAIACRLGLERAFVVIFSRRQMMRLYNHRKSWVLMCWGWHAMSRMPITGRILSSKFGRLDIFVSNAVVSPSTDPVRSISEGSLDKLWDINGKAIILL
ncbi:hypothetical protein GOP47_0014400 [Adiantum capillus-veneris]|uniref:Uncharacterized protein n=1 Tax=Adiantum capillus-veneris TaxID=13818 RepID=A0A9D4ZDG6_ADICA|nr:hypothetical protein GOP47_0014400 [Adiantum capillus-veneris]